MSKLLVANFKMNPRSEREAVQLARSYDREGVVICPPFPFLAPVGTVLRKAWLGAQDVFWQEGGAYTGEVSAAILKNAGVEYVIIGHSERRKWLHETDEIINKKVTAALGAGLKVILCVGERKEVRKKGIEAAKRFVKAQLQNDLKGVKNWKLKIKNLIVAYEPVWAISTSQSAKSRDNADTPEDAVQMVKFIRMAVSPRVRVVYGGSVTFQNARIFLKYGEIGGALIGAASLHPGEFKKIIRIAEKL